MPQITRPSGRAANQLRSLNIEHNYTKHAEGSVLISCGDTRVLCTASVENRVPPFLRNTGKGWVTAEYSMLPGSTNNRKARDGRTGRIDGRSQEIQRLIGRSLRSVCDMDVLGERSITVDCDVLQADGGTRTASITGGALALADAIGTLPVQGAFKEFVASISVGIYKGTPVLDLDYAEDSNAETDMNVVRMGSGGFIEIQGTAEAAPFSGAELSSLIALAEKGTNELITLQQVALEQG